MNRLTVPSPVSGGLLLTYKCDCGCKHCMYACSPKWPSDWIRTEDLQTYLSELAGRLQPSFCGPDHIDLASGLHFTGGEPFLNFGLLLEAVEISRDKGIPSTFVETNCRWCSNDEAGEDKLRQLKQAGLRGMMASVNPFLLEHVPFERTRRCARIGKRIFGRNCLVYQKSYYDQFDQMGLVGTLAFEKYIQQTGHESLRCAEVIPMGRLPFSMGYLYEKRPAESFFGQSCRSRLTSPHHIHIDNYGNYMAGFCGGVSLGDARHLDSILEGVDLDQRPILKALVTGLGGLYEIGRDFGYEQLSEGYVSACHLCLDIRRHVAEQTDEFKELSAKANILHHLTSPEKRRS